MSRTRRNPKPKPGVAHYAAPAAFLAAVTIAVLLFHSGLSHHTNSKATTTAAAPARTTATTAAPHTNQPKKFYVVQAGDTFGTIASKEGISVAQLQALNPGTSSNALQVGQKLRVK